MNAPNAILSRLATGRPLLISADPAASLRWRGVSLETPTELGRIVREASSAVAEHYLQEIASGVDVLCALTGETMPRALHEYGMAFRAAALTGTAVELALEAAEQAPRPVVVAGVLGTWAVAPTELDRMQEEYDMHAARLAAAGCEVIIARGFGRFRFGSPEEAGPLARLSRREAVKRAAATGLPAWALIAIDEHGATPDGELLEDAADAALDVGAQALLFELPSVDAGIALFDRMRGAAGKVPVGVVAASLHMGASDDHTAAWASGAKRLLQAGVQLIGGGSGTTPRNIAALVTSLRASERPSIFPHAL